MHITHVIISGFDVCECMDIQTRGIVQGRQAGDGGQKVKVEGKGFCVYLSHHLHEPQRPDI